MQRTSKFGVIKHEKTALINIAITAGTFIYILMVPQIHMLQDDDVKPFICGIWVGFIFSALIVIWTRFFRRIKYDRKNPYDHILNGHSRGYNE